MKREPSGAPDSAVQNTLDLMREFAEVRARAMFGGHGLYREGLMFALLADGGLYLKVDEQSRPVFAGRNLSVFSFTAKGRTVQLSYHEAPPEALEDRGAMADWCRLAWQAALRARAKGAKKAARNPVRAASSSCATKSDDGLQQECDGGVVGSLRDLPNLGPRSIAWLSAVGITSLDRLRELGAVRAFVQARAHDPAVSLNLLWGLEGALTGRRWQDVEETDRASLLMALEDVVRFSLPDAG